MTDHLLDDRGRARLAVLAVFFVHGAVYGSWAARIPAVQDHLHLAPGSLGIVLAGPGIGALLGSQVGGKLINRVGSRAMSAAAPLVLCVPLGLVPIAGGPWELMAILIVMGAGDGCTAVAMSMQAIAVQDAYGRPLLNGMHATRSIGAVLGVLGGVLTVAIGLPLDAQLPITAIVLGVLSAAVLPWLLPRVQGPEATVTARPPGRRLPWRSIILLSLLTFLVSLIEDAQASWSGLYLAHVGVGPTLASAGYGLFSAGELVSRLFNDRLVARTGWVRVIRAGTLTCAVFLVAMLILGNGPFALATLVVVGIGISAVFPGAFAGAGSLPPETQGTAMGQVNFAGNLGWVLVSPIIGGLTSLTSLPAALGLLPAAAVIIAYLAFATQPRVDWTSTGA